MENEFRTQMKNCTVFASMVLKPKNAIHTEYAVFIV